MNSYPDEAKRELAAEHEKLEEAQREILRLQLALKHEKARRELLEFRIRGFVEGLPEELR